MSPEVISMREPDAPTTSERVLLTLLEKPGEVVTREELRFRLWPADTHVNYDANVNTTVNKLRQALGDSSEKPLYIETIPRKGYCLIVQPEFAEDGCVDHARNYRTDPGGHAPGSGDYQALDLPFCGRTGRLAVLILVQF